MCCMDTVRGITILYFLLSPEQYSDRRIVLPVSALFIVVFSAMMVMAVIIYRYEKGQTVTCQCSLTKLIKV